MFLDEARLVALLDHHNIPAVLDVDVVDGNHYLAMEYVHGVDLRELLAAAQRDNTPVPFEAAGLSQMARSFYDDNKRVANRRIKTDLMFDQINCHIPPLILDE